MHFSIDKTDLADIEKLITNENFTQFLLSNTTAIEHCMFIIQTLMDKIDELKEELD